MKSFKFVLIALTLTAVLLSACGGNTVNDNTNASSSGGDNASVTTPTEVPTEVPTDEPTAEDLLGNCYTPYYPVEEGKVWHYFIETPGLDDMDLYVSFSDIDATGFTATQRANDLETNVRWICTEEGLVTSQYANVSVAQNYLEFNTTNYSGITLPPVAQMVAGNSWASSFDIQAAIDMQGTAMETSLTVSITETGIGEEDYSGPMGDYTALKTRQEGLITVTSPAEVSVPFGSDFYYVQGVGLVQAVTNFGTYTSVMTLMDVQGE